MNLRAILKSETFRKVWVYAILLLFSLRLLSFVHSYSINLLFWDQWDSVDTILDNDLFKLFLFQNNEHRVGTGYLLIKLLAHISHWNTRIEVFFTAFLLIISAIIAISLKEKFTRISVFDIFIPMIFLNLFQVENLFQGFQITFVLPLVFLFIGVYVFTLSPSYKRDVLIMIAVLLSAYSSFHGLFLGIATLLFYAHELFVYGKTQFVKNIFYFIITFFILVSYFINYNFSAATITLPQSVYYTVQFPLLLVGRFYGSQTGYILGIITLGLVLIGFSCLIQRRYSFRKMFPLLSFLGYSAFFIGSIIMGRNDWGLEQINATRYLTHLIPLFFSLYVPLTLIESKFIKHGLISCLLGLYVWFSYSNNSLILSEAKYYKSGLSAWKRCYKERLSVNFCNQKTGFLIFREEGSQFLETKLQLLQEKKLNLFAE